MIHHLSVSAHDPKRVADFFAELFAGVCIDFRPHPGSYMALKADGFGTSVEVYPAGSVLTPNGAPGAAFMHRPVDGPQLTPTHFALSVEADIATVQAMAEARGWACHICNRGGNFRVMEVWIENEWLVEILPPAFAAEYLGFVGAAMRMTDPNRALAPHAPHPA